MIVLDLFKEITKIPRCSGVHEPFIEHLKQYALKYDYVLEIDNANNVLCKKKNYAGKICLQSHYDIVCLNEGVVPEVLEDEGFLKAKNSTLGADNGIGCAYMLALMQEGVECEYLFTCDEEIGLIGANNIGLSLESKYMLNLDSEMQGEICIGCAGGLDIFGVNTQSEYLQNTQNKSLYEITLDGLDGGHSGVDIDKSIPNALKLIIKSIKESGADLLDIQGGERINSIPKGAKAFVASSKTPSATHPNMKVEKLNSTTEHYKKLDSRIIDFLYSFANGVRGYDTELGVVLSSINLAIVKNEIDGCHVSLSARSMDNNALKELSDETISMLHSFGFEVDTDGKYPAWKPVKSDFTNNVLHIYKKHEPTASIKAIHAGLECAIFSSKYPDMQICSIGPNIYFPHSFNERCEISSVIIVYEVLKDIIASYKK